MKTSPKALRLPYSEQNWRRCSASEPAQPRRSREADKARGEARSRPKPAALRARADGDRFHLAGHAAR